MFMFDFHIRHNGIITVFVSGKQVLNLLFRSIMFNISRLNLQFYFEGLCNYVISKYFLNKEPNATIFQNKQQNFVMSLYTEI